MAHDPVRPGRTDPKDFLAIDSLLDDDERLIRDTVREFVADRILPGIADWFEAGAFPQHLARGAGGVINGSKMWITSGGIADVAVVWAQTDDGIRGFIVPTGTPGFVANDIHHKMSLRASVTSELVLTDVRLPGSFMLPHWVGTEGPLPSPAG